MFMYSFLDHPSASIFHAAHHDKCMRIDLFYFCIKPRDLKPRDYSIYDIHVTSGFATFTIASSSFIHGDATTHYFDNHTPDFIMLWRNNGNASILFYAFKQKVECL